MASNIRLEDNPLFQKLIYSLMLANPGADPDMAAQQAQAMMQKMWSPENFSSDLQIGELGQPLDNSMPRPGLPLKGAPFTWGGPGDIPPPDDFLQPPEEDKEDKDKKEDEVKPPSDLADRARAGDYNSDGNRGGDMPAPGAGYADPNLFGPTSFLGGVQLAINVPRGLYAGLTQTIPGKTPVETPTITGMPQLPSMPQTTPQPQSVAPETFAQPAPGIENEYAGLADALLGAPSGLSIGRTEPQTGLMGLLGFASKPSGPSISRGATAISPGPAPEVEPGVSMDTYNPMDDQGFYAGLNAPGMEAPNPMDSPGFYGAVGGSKSNQYGNTPQEQREFESRQKDLADQYSKAFSYAYGEPPSPTTNRGMVSQLEAAFGINGLMSPRGALPDVNMENISATPTPGVSDDPTLDPIGLAPHTMAPVVNDTLMGAPSPALSNGGAGKDSLSFGPSVSQAVANQAMANYNSQAPQVGVPSAVPGYTQIGLGQAINEGKIGVDNNPANTGLFGPDPTYTGIDFNEGMYGDTGRDPSGREGGMGGGGSSGYGGGEGGNTGASDSYGGYWRKGGFVPRDKDRKLEARKGTVHEMEHIMRPEATVYWEQKYPGMLAMMNKMGSKERLAAAMMR